MIKNNSHQEGAIQNHEVQSEGISHNDVLYYCTYSSSRRDHSLDFDSSRLFRFIFFDSRFIRLLLFVSSVCQGLLPMRCGSLLGIRSIIPHHHTNAFKKAVQSC